MEIYGRDKICIIEILIPMLIQYKLQPQIKEGSCYFRGLKFCMKCFLTKLQPGWQKQGHTWHIVPRNYSTKIRLIDLIMEKNWGKEENSGRKMEKSEG